MTPHRSFIVLCFLCSVHNVVSGYHRDVAGTNETYLFVCVSFRKRAPYIAYLTRCRQGLQTSQAHLERLLQRVLRDKEVANRYFTTVCVRLLLEHMESKMLDFIKGIPSLKCLTPSWTFPVWFSTSWHFCHFLKFLHMAVFFLSLLFMLKVAGGDVHFVKTSVNSFCILTAITVTEFDQ